MSDTSSSLAWATDESMCTLLTDTRVPTPSPTVETMGYSALHASDASQAVTSWEGNDLMHGIRLEQYIVIVYANIEWFFKVSLWLEETGRGGPRPHVFVQLDKPDRSIGKARFDVMLFLGMELQVKMLEALEKAVASQFGPSSME